MLRSLRTVLVMVLGTEFMNVLRPRPESSLDRTAPYDVEVSRSGNPKASLDRTAPYDVAMSRNGSPKASRDRNRPAPRHDPPQPIQSFPSVTPSSLARCLLVAFALLKHTHERAPGRWPGAASCRDPGKGWRTTRLRSHSLHPTHPTSGHTNPPCVTKHDPSPCPRI